MNQAHWDISFEGLNYSVSGWRDGLRTNKKEILKNINGEFRACELSAVLGQSGCGKTSLLNVLSGYKRKNVGGWIRINGDEDVKEIKNRSNYIMQNYTLHRFVTVREAMMFAVNLKLHGVSETCTNGKIASILDNLGLTDRQNIYSGDLSGGEQKRLSIALELVDDPAILFLDEPTTGLDSSSSTQCVQLLKKLAQEGKTIICTIHAPSALLFDMFDHVYALADGCCIYRGSSENLVSFLIELDLVCPETFNPADFLLEIANNDYGLQNSRLTEKIQNGVNCDYRSSNHENMTMQRTYEFTQELKESPSIFNHRLRVLLHRNFLISTRDKTLTLMRLAIHLVMAIFVGIIYQGIGDDASNIVDNYKFLFFNIFILMFTAFSSLQTSFPLDLPITRREHFNGWYTSSCYYLALTIIDIPIIIATTLIYIVITFIMTSQPMQLYRLCAYYLTILLVSFAAQGLGLMAGSLMNVKFTLILGSFFICPFVLFSNFFVQVNDTAPIFHWIFETSFIKHGLDGSMQAIFGFDRPKMDCDAVYCHFAWPNKFLESFGISDSFPSVIAKLTLFTFVFRFAAFVIMWYRLKH